MPPGDAFNYLAVTIGTLDSILTSDLATTYGACKYSKGPKGYMNGKCPGGAPLHDCLWKNLSHQVTGHAVPRAGISAKDMRAKFKEGSRIATVVAPRAILGWARAFQYVGTF